MCDKIFVSKKAWKYVMQDSPSLAFIVIENILNVFTTFIIHV